jgi:hypothetical protein
MAKGKGKGPDFKTAAEKAKDNSGGGEGWYKVTATYVKFTNPLSEYHVTLEKEDPPA